MSDYMTPYQKVKGNHYSPLHMRALAKYLCANVNNCNGVILDVRKNNYSMVYEDSELHSFITANWNENQVREANDAVRATYNKSGKRGRPYGSKNKPKTDADALEILGDLQNADDESDIYKDSALTQEKDTPKSEPTSEDAKKYIAKLFGEFLERYNQDHNQHSKDIQDGLASILAEVDRQINNLKPNIIELKRIDLPNINMGIQHKNFKILLMMCSAQQRNGAHNNVWIYGPAGTGKSTAAEKVAEAFGLPYYTDGKMADETKVLGYQDANGVYRTTNFRKAFEFGGVYLADEIDGSMPDALLALNGALANGHCSFPDKIVTRHPDFIMLAAANTTGTGGTIEYVGRFKQDAAFTDRWCYLAWPIDNALEDSLVANKSWLAYVRHVRGKLEASGIKGHLITPRASIYGETLLAAGLDLEDVKLSLLKKGLTDTQWNMIK